MTLSAQVHGKGVASRPQLRILHPLDDDYEDLSCDALSIRGYQNYRCRDYHLGECLLKPFVTGLSVGYKTETVQPGRGI